jgi:hypothetical protein
MQRVAHAATRLDVPCALWCDAGGLPKLAFFYVGPESSARETNSAPAAAKCLNASTAVAVSRTCAGSLDGPTMIKLLCMTVREPAVISHVLCCSFWIADRPPNATFLFGSVPGGPRRIHALYPWLGVWR